MSPAEVVTHLLLTQTSEDGIWSVKEVERGIEFRDAPCVHDQDSVVKCNSLKSMGDRDELKRVSVDVL